MGEDGQRPFHVLFRHLQLDAAYGDAVEPIGLHQMLVDQVAADALGQQSPSGDLRIGHEIESGYGHHGGLLSLGRRLFRLFEVGFEGRRIAVVDQITASLQIGLALEGVGIDLDILNDPFNPQQIRAQIHEI